MKKGPCSIFALGRFYIDLFPARHWEYRDDGHYMSLDLGRLTLGWRLR